MDHDPEIHRDFYVYRSNIASIAAGANASDTINIEADSDFILQKMSYHVDIAAAAYTSSARPIPNVSIQLTDTGSGRQVFSGAIPIPAVFGTGELPFLLPNPRRFSANSTLALSYANFDAAITYRIYLCFIGMKVYR
jgi:hypothetical protein